MNPWTVTFLPEADADIRRLDKAMQAQVRKGIRKAARNPLSASENGYGKPLRNGPSTKPSELCRITRRVFVGIPMVV